MAGPFSIEAGDPRFVRLFFEATMRPSTDIPRITTVRSVSLARGSSETTVGLTSYTPPDSTGRSAPVQRLSFFSQLLGGLSEPAAIAVIAHELAHAWLNEHLMPEESKAREMEADALARRWGFGPELDALDREAETVSS